MAQMETSYNAAGQMVITRGSQVVTCENDANPTNRVFDGWFGDASEGEEYISEWSACGTDQDGNVITVRWQFDAVKGSEPEDDEWPWGDAGHIRLLD